MFSCPSYFTLSISRSDPSERDLGHLDLDQTDGLTEQALRKDFVHPPGTEISFLPLDNLESIILDDCRRLLSMCERIFYEAFGASSEHSENEKLVTATNRVESIP